MSFFPFKLQVYKPMNDSTLTQMRKSLDFYPFGNILAFILHYISDFQMIKIASLFGNILASILHYISEF